MNESHRNWGEFREKEGGQYALLLKSEFKEKKGTSIQTRDSRRKKRDKKGQNHKEALKMRQIIQKKK